MTMFKSRAVLKFLGGILLGVLVLAAAGWIAFVPPAQEPPYEFIKTWGGKGSAPGQFNDPTGIAVAAGELFVADSRNGRIQVFDLYGNFRRQFGRPGDQVGELSRPMNLSIYNGELYVPEYFNDRVQVFSLDGISRRIIGSPGSGPGEFSAPGGVAVDKNGDVYVADFYGQRVQKLKPDGTFIQQWGTTGQTSHDSGSFYYPTDVALGKESNLYVADGYGNRIQVFSPEGTFLRKWGGPLARGIYGPFNGWFTTVTSIAFGPEGNLFVADFYNDRVQKFSPNGTFLTNFGRRGAGPGQFNHAMAAAVARDESVFITDLGNNRIQKWQPASPKRQDSNDEKQNP